jgi:hypothetical protein
MVFTNLDAIRFVGLDAFLDVQRIRMEMLTDFLARFDDGRSKSFYCLVCTLLPIDQLMECREFMKAVDQSGEVKLKCKILKDRLQQVASDLNIELKLQVRGK